MDSEELLEQLADIHLPQAVSYWPPAPGWWILALLLLITSYFLVKRYLSYITQQRICQHALAELNRCYREFAAAEGVSRDEANLRYVNAFNSVLRRVALVHFPLANVASLDGREWVDFIREKGDSTGLTEEIATALSYGRFQMTLDVDVDAMNNLGLAWIRSLYLGRSGTESDQLHVAPTHKGLTT
ncbi:MAG: DUF4381 domain-containing protein [Proteobacteria bacterium]|nr:DUF4381 domain-containing protein [Pseudomonadota bacterium]